MPPQLTLHVARNGQTICQFPIETAQQCLDSQIILPTDLCWHEGMTEWKPVNEIVAKHPPQLVTPPPYNPPVPATPTASGEGKKNLIRNLALAGGALFGCVFYCFFSSILSDTDSSDDSRSLLPSPIEPSTPTPNPAEPPTPSPKPKAEPTITICDQFNLVVEQTAEGIILKLNTDLPNDAPIGISVSRSYFHDGKGLLQGRENEEYSIDYYNEQRKLLNSWKDGLEIKLDNQKWISELRAKALKLGFGVRLVKNQVEVRAIVNIPDTKKLNIQGKATVISDFGDKMLESEIQIVRPIRTF